MLFSEVIQSINVCCCQARQKLKSRQATTNQSGQQADDRTRSPVACSTSMDESTSDSPTSQSEKRSDTSSRPFKPATWTSLTEELRRRKAFAAATSPNEPAADKSSSSDGGQVPEQSVDDVIKDSVNMSLMDLTK